MPATIAQQVFWPVTHVHKTVETPLKTSPKKSLQLPKTGSPLHHQASDKRLIQLARVEQGFGATFDVGKHPKGFAGEQFKANLKTRFRPGQKDVELQEG